MTREEREDAINCFKNKLENEVYGAKYNKLAIEALEQESVLDKIRAEMEQIKEAEYQIYGKGSWRFVDKCLDIIDKYKAESEPQESEDKE